MGGRGSGAITRTLAEGLGLAAAGAIGVAFSGIRLLGPERAGRFAASLVRRAGRMLREDRIALDNLKAAFPQKSPEELRFLADSSWENLGRTAAEYPFLEQLFDYNYYAPDPASRTEVIGVEQFIALLNRAGPAIVFCAHLGNWEMVAVAARRYGLEATIVFRPPNNPVVDRVIAAVRGRAMGVLLPSGPGAAAAMAGVLERGGILGMLADQHFTRGIPVPFFGRPAMTNPVLAKMARHFECPVRGARCIRLPGNRFRLELTPPLDLPRDAEGRVDVERTTALITATIEGWVRDNPEQWLWQHRRWRVAARPAAPVV